MRNSILGFYKKVLVITLATVSLSLFNLPAFTSESKLSDCLLNASSKQLVSLGQPVAQERLAHKSKIRIGVLPYYFYDENPKILNNFEKSDYLQAVEVIRKLSNNTISIDVVFFPSYKIDKPASSLTNILKQKNRDFNDIENSTWGFVKKTILEADKDINFSAVDSVILEGNILEQSFSGAEAMVFLRGSQGNVYEYWENDFFKPLKTKEGFVDNAILLIGHKSVNTISHELMHNFGLTDLYGSGSGPGLLSMMALGSGLLNYEKAVLGWFPKTQFTCKNYVDFLNENIVDNELVIDNFKQDSIFLLKLSDDKAYLVEVINRESKSLLVLYLLEQDRRPPITVFYDANKAFSNFDIKEARYIGSTYEALDFQLLVKNVSGNTATLNFIPNNLIGSSEAKSLHQQSLANKEAAEKARAEAAEKARAESNIVVKPKVRVSNKLTIVCVKGKLIKKLTSVNPKCPVGFKKK